MEINNCPTCGGKVEFSPDDKALKCEKCSNIFTIDYKTSKDKKSINDSILLDNEKGYEKWKESKRTFQCSNCGAQIILNKYEMTSKCSYCNTHSLIPTEQLPGLKPDSIIPFKISKEKAKEQFKLKTKKKMFLPNDFKRNIPKTQIGATYLSSFSFAMDVSATYDGIRAVSRTVTRRVRTQNGIRTITDTVTEYVPFSGSITQNLDNIVVESSDKIEQYQINSILPYYFKECYEYNDDFLTGFSVGYYNQTVSETTKVAEAQALSSLDRIIRNKHGSVTSLNIYPKYSNQKYNYVLLPLYFINFRYKDKEYLNLMNGQTGKTSGSLPRSGLKITLFTLFIILIVVGFPLLIILLSSLN